MRSVVELLLQRVPSSADVGGSELARRVALAPCGPVVEGTLEPDQLRLELLARTVSPFGSTAESSTIARTRSGNMRCVRRAEVGAVRDAEVRDLVVAERRSDRVHVACRVRGRVEAQRVAVLLLAAVDEAGVGLVLQRLLLGRVGCVVDVEVLDPRTRRRHSGARRIDRRPAGRSRSGRAMSMPSPLGDTRCR